VKLIDLDKLVLVQINLVKHLFKGQALLLQHFEKVIEDVVLGHHPLFFGLQLLHSLFIVHPVEGIELGVLDHAVAISVNL
jgi:hypothetical protein